MPFQIDTEKKIFLSSTGNMSYAFAIRENGVPVNLHWGGRIDRLADLTDESEISWFRISHYNWRGKSSRLDFPAYAPQHHYEPCLKLSSPGRALELKYESRRLENENHLIITLRESVSGSTGISTAESFI